MASFLVRVELYGSPSRQDYESLHSTMGKNGFSRTITSTQGIVYDLPTATYSCTANATPRDICDIAKAVTNKIWHDSATIATQTNGTSWDGLRKH